LKLVPRSNPPFLVAAAVLSVRASQSITRYVLCEEGASAIAQCTTLCHAQNTHHHLSRAYVGPPDGRRATRHH
jgi:hypothetical protein